MQKTFRFLKLSGKKAIVLVILIATVLTATVSGTVAYIVTRTTSKPNTFSPAEIEISSWNYHDVINAGDSQVYVRASIVTAWVSNEDKRTVWSTTPKENVDYTLTINEGWFMASDGFYYRREKMNAAQSVDFVSATQLTQKDGYTLRVLVMYSAIQSTPKDAIESSWTAVKVADDGTLEAK
jgi:hypothetical protein